MTAEPQAAPIAPALLGSCCRRLGAGRVRGVPDLPARPGVLARIVDDAITGALWPYLPSPAESVVAACCAVVVLPLAVAIHRPPGSRTPSIPSRRHQAIPAIAPPLRCSGSATG